MKTDDTVRKTAELPEGETYYALVDDSISSHDGYDPREGGGWTTNPYIRIVFLGNKEQAVGWMHQQEKRRDGGFSVQPYKIAQMKICPVQRTLLIDL